MARKRHSNEDILKPLREIELHLASGSDVPTAAWLRVSAMRHTTIGARG
jgi:hypothetical protein